MPHGEFGRRSPARAARAAVVVGATALLAPVPLLGRYSSDLTWYWAINWDSGFVRRGLCGELAQAVQRGGDLESAAQLMTGVSASAATVTLTVVAVLRLWRGDPVSVVLGVALLIGPLGVVLVCLDPRPEYLGFPAVLLAMAACHSWARGHRRAAVCWLWSAGLLIGVVTLASENVLFAVLPWCLVLLTATTVGAPTVERARAIAVLTGPSAVSAVAVVLGGRADASQVAALEVSASRLDGQPEAFMRFVGQDVGESLRMVAHADVPRMVTTMLVAWLIVALVAVLLLACGVGRRRATLPVDAPLRIALCLPMAALAFQTATGIDWSRWVGQLGCGALLTLTGWGVLVPDRDPVRWSVRRTGALVLCTCVLLVVPAVPYGITKGNLAEFATSRIG